MDLDYDLVIDAIQRGDVPALEAFAAACPDFPTGRDSLVGDTWLSNAIDCGPVTVVRWMLDHGAAVNFEADDGYSALHSAIERKFPDRHEILEMLCAAGADVNVHGLNDWTPLHLAAARNDVEAIRILLAHGARTDERTRIDWEATPLEEARKLSGDTEAVRFLTDLEARSSKD